MNHVYKHCIASPISLVNSDVFLVHILCFLSYFKVQICAYTHFRSKHLKKKNPQDWGGGVTPPNIPKLGVSDVKDTAKTNKDFGLSCYLQVEYSVFFSW